jgi:ABC-type phosphate transport system substrate-binding protein
MADDSRKHLKRNFGKLVLAVIFAGAAGIGSAYSDNLVLQGSTAFTTTLARPYAEAVEAQTGHHLEVISNKSNFGLLALFEYKADLAMISTTLESELEILRRSNPELPFQRLRVFEIARTRAVFVVHPSNPVRNARLQDIRKVLIGEFSNWQQLGGPNLPIRVVAIREGGGGLAKVEATLLGGAHISASDVIRVQMGPQIVKVVAQEPGALGITHLAIVKASATVELVTDEKIEQVLSLVSLDDPSPNAIAVIDAFRQIANKGN